jgi:hypothetical protein
VSPVKYEIGFYIQENNILLFVTVTKRRTQIFPVRAPSSTAQAARADTNNTDVKKKKKNEIFGSYKSRIFGRNLEPPSTE